MEEGHLIIETHREHPDFVRIRTSKAPPAEPNPGDDTGTRILFVARFIDLSAAQMQTHTRLRRGLIDIDSGVYRSDPVAAVAAAQSLALGHRQVYLDPELARSEALASAIARHRRRHNLADRMWMFLGVVAVIVLLVKVFIGF